MRWLHDAPAAPRSNNNRRACPCKRSTPAPHRRHQLPHPHRTSLPSSSVSRRPGRAVILLSSVPPCRSSANRSPKASTLARAKATSTSPPATATPPWPPPDVSPRSPPRQPPLLERTAAGGRLDVGSGRDAEDLRSMASFDVVVSTFGVMFAPQRVRRARCCACLAAAASGWRTERRRPRRPFKVIGERRHRRARYPVVGHAAASRLFGAQAADVRVQRKEFRHSSRHWIRCSAFLRPPAKLRRARCRAQRV